MVLSTRSLRLALVLGNFGLAACQAAAQCGDRWASAGDLSSINGTAIASIKWDPDRSGPRGPVLVVAGDFTSVGGTSARGLATFDASANQWSPLEFGIAGAGPSVVNALAVLPDGRLVAGGSFVLATGGPVIHIAVLESSGWRELDGGVNGVVRAMAMLPTGELAVGGTFTSAGGIPSQNVAVWDGAFWRPIGGVVGTVRAMAVLPTGELAVGGTFTSAGGGVPALNVSIWNGLFWSALGEGVNSHVMALAAPASGPLSGRVFAAGNFTLAGGREARFIAQWDGTAWSPLAGGLEYQAYAIVSLPERQGGGIAVGGNFNWADSIPGTNAIARWDGASWSALAGGLAFPSVQTMSILPNGDLAVGGSFSSPQGISPRFARVVFGGQCPADVDCSGTLSPADIFAFLSVWFANADGADFNHSGQVNAQDIFDFLGAWFAGC